MRRVDAGLIGRRLSWQRVNGTVFGTVSVALIVGVAGAGILGGLFVAESTRLFYEPDVPGDMVALGFGRQLTDTEVRALSAGAGSAVIEDRRVEFNGSVVVVDSPVTQCKSDPTNILSHCVETVGYMEDFVVMVEPSSAAGFLGRELTHEETAAIETGDGLLLSEPRDDPQLVYSASIQSENAQDGGSRYTQSISPVPVPGYSGFERIPGLLIGPDALERWSLDVDTDPISYYLLTPYRARPTEEAVREALPRDVAATADVIMNREEEMNDANSAVQQTIIAVAAGLVFLVVTLLILAWVAGSTETLRRLSHIGAPTRILLAVVLVRSVRAVFPAAFIGVGVAAGLTWAFSEYVGVSIPIVGWMWLVPGLTAIVAVHVAALLRVGLARELKG